MATRLVPFATDGSNPRKIKTGKVSEDPPPALTFINAAIAPTTNKIIIPKRSGTPFL
jgi:hypothetical protein